MKKILTILMAVAMLAASSTVAFAAEQNTQLKDIETQVITTKDEGIMPLLDYDYTVGPDWKTIATGSLSGAMVRINVIDFNGILHQVNVRYLHNGAEILRQDNVTGASNETVVTCPAGTTEVQMQIKPRADWFVQDHWYHVAVTY